MNAGDLLNDKYRIEKLLGQGGMGAVYLAENQDVGRKVAIKLLRTEYASDAEALTRFKNEARAAAAIGHPGIVDVLDMGTTAQGAPYIVMERLRGETLRDRLTSLPPLSLEQAVQIVIQVLEVLSAAHAAGVIHRDLKPDNIFVQPPPAAAVKILDFGISKFRDGPAAHVTQTGQVMGTPLYMSPEQAKGSRDVGVSADIYSIGAILYEVIAGRPPYPGSNYTEVLAKLLTEPLPPLNTVRPGLPPLLCSVVERMLEKDPALRPADSAAAAEALRGSLVGGTGPLLARSVSGEVPALGQTTPSAQRAKSTFPPVASPRPRSKEVLLGGGILAAGAAISAAVWFLWVPSHPSADPMPVPVAVTVPAVPALAAPASAPPKVPAVPAPPPAPVAAASASVASLDPPTTSSKGGHGSHHRDATPSTVAPAALAPTPTPAPTPAPTPPSATNPSPDPAPAAPALAPSSSAPSGSVGAGTFTGRYQGFMDQDSQLIALPPSTMPHRHIAQGLTITEAGGIVGVTFSGPPPCTLRITRVGNTHFVVVPNQICEAGGGNVSRPIRFLAGKGSVEGNEATVSVTGTTAGANGSGTIHFESTFRGERGS